MDCRLRIAAQDRAETHQTKANEAFLWATMGMLSPNGRNPPHIQWGQSPLDMPQKVEVG